MDKKCRCGILAVALYMVAGAAGAGELTIGDRADVRIWYNQSNNGSGKGVSCDVELKSIENGSGGELIYSFTFDNNAGGRTPFPMPPEGYTIGIRFSNYKPAAVISGSARLLSGPWITGIVSNFGFSGAAELYFPVLPSDRSYDVSDWYQVRLNDTISLYCKYNPEQRAFFGTIKQYRGRDDSSGEIIIAGDKYCLYTKDAPFRIGMIVIHSSVTQLVNKNFTGLGNGYYGLTIGSYSSSNQTNMRNTPGQSKSQGRTIRKYDGQGRVR